MKKLFIFALLSIAVGQLYGILPGEPNPFTTDVRPAQPDPNLINIRPAQPDPSLFNVRAPEESLYHRLYPEEARDIQYPTIHDGKPITVRPLNKATAGQVAK